MLDTISPRNWQITERLLELQQHALEEHGRILSASLRQGIAFFLAHPGLRVPTITETPAGTLRVRWVQGIGRFTALEFMGTPLVELMAEIPQGNGETRRHCSAEPLEGIVARVHALGASFA